MYNRADIVDQNFLRRVETGDLPVPRSTVAWSDTDLPPEVVVDLFESQMISRHLDLAARRLKAENQCYYTIGSSGHEGNAVFGQVFRYTDIAFLHYRSGALMVQRAKQRIGIDPVMDTLLSLVASSDDPIAGGRHKVWGSAPLMVPPQTSTIASHLPKAVGAALSIGRAQDLNINPPIPADGVVVCSFGDASVNHSTALGAINSAIWTAYQNLPLPLVFICEDNGIGISVPTPAHWIEDCYAERPQLMYVQTDGQNLFDLYMRTREAEQHAREQKKPVFLHMKTVRLLGHAGSDVETSYISREQMEYNEARDPLLYSARLVIDNDIMQAPQVLTLYEEVRQRVDQCAREAVNRPKLETAAAVRATLTMCSSPRAAPPMPAEDRRQWVFGPDYDKLATPQHMAKLISWGLHDILLRYDAALVFGEDVAQKGGVYNVTDGLYAKFGPKRVFNSLLDEQSIIGSAIGLAHNGLLPIPEVQFLAYVHNAEDQIRGEAATLAFFSQGQYTNPMVLRVAGLAYQKGFGGHFHNENSLAVLRDVPGLIIAVPSNGADAVTMMRACVRAAHEQGRVCVFVEPIALYMQKDLYQPGDKGWCFAYPSPDRETPPGEFAIHGGGGDLTILSYGNGAYYSLQAQRVLAAEHNVHARVIDLRWVAPVDEARLCAELVTQSHVLIVDECRKTGSWSEALVALMVEFLHPLPAVKVLAGDDCFIPLGKAATAGLPGKAEIVAASLELIAST